MSKSAALCAQARVGPWPKTGSQAEPASPSSSPFLRGKPYGLGHTPAAIPPASARCRSRFTCRRFRAPGRQPFRLLAQRVPDTRAQAISTLTRQNRLLSPRSPSLTAPIRPLHHHSRSRQNQGQYPGADYHRTTRQRDCLRPWGNVPSRPKFRRPSAHHTGTGPSAVPGSLRLPSTPLQNPSPARTARPPPEPHSASLRALCHRETYKGLPASRLVQTPTKSPARPYPVQDSRRQRLNLLARIIFGADSTLIARSGRNEGRYKNTQRAAAKPLPLRSIM